MKKYKVLRPDGWQIFAIIFFSATTFVVAYLAILTIQRNPLVGTIATAFVAIICFFVIKANFPLTVMVKVLANQEWNSPILGSFYIFEHNGCFDYYKIKIAKNDEYVKIKNDQSFVGFTKGFVLGQSYFQCKRRDTVNKIYIINCSNFTRFPEGFHAPFVFVKKCSNFTGFEKTNFAFTDIQITHCPKYEGLPNDIEVRRSKVNGKC